MPNVTDITTRKGVAGQYEVTVLVQYPDEPAERLTPAGQTFVSQAVTDRIGSTLNAEWIQRFFSDKKGE